MENILQMVREYLPEPETMLGEFTFLAPDALWTGEAEAQPFVAVAEDRWTVDSGVFLMVTGEGAVYVADLEDNHLLHYCAAGFPQFMEIMKLYQTALETVASPDVFDEEGFEECAEAERVLRQQIREIDPTALEDEEGFWSLLVEELGAGM